MRIARWLFASCLIFAASHASAWDLLYRGDSREPDIIFREGFQAAGTNRNVLAHISGDSCWLGDGTLRSAYVATTQIEADARQYGASVYAQRSYVYHIVPDADAPDDTAMFDAREGLRALGAPQNPHGLDFRVLTTIWRLTQFHATQGQHFAERIPAEWIQSVDVYERDANTGELGFLRNYLNPHFVGPLHVGSRDAFTPTMVAALAPVETIAMAGSGGNATTACLGGCASSARSLEQCSIEEVFEPGNPFQQLMDVILD
jgi:hypothetical protein